MISYISYDIITDIIYDIQVLGRKTYAGMTDSAAYEHFTGKECLDVHLLKQIPPKRNLEWTAAELNAILENNLVPSHNGKGQLRTFGCIQWECELYSGRPKARCYPFNMKGLRFRGKNCQVLHMI